MQLGTMIAGRYRLDDRIAAGGMGEVWRGTDTRLNRAVAVKLLHAGLAGNDRFRARFHQEAQAVAALQSPGIVALYDYGEESSPEGLVSYLIMELVRGTSLDKLIHQRGRLSPSETLKITATAAEALDVAHRAGIIHRDIKPGNLLVDEDGSVKIVDFGIASARGQAGLTETGTVMGTLNYASPEQLSGGELTGGTDLYSLGIVAYECLSGRAPFGGNDPAAVITQHMTGQPGPLPADVPQPVAQIVARCLAKDPRQRFSSAGELARACREGRPGPGTTAMPAPGAPQAQTTQVMAQGAVPAGQTQVIGQGDPGGPGPDLPPPRDFEEPKRSKAVPIILTVAGVLVLVVALLVWSLQGEDPPPTAEDDPDTAATSEEAPSPSEDAGEDADDQEQQAEDEGEPVEEDDSDDQEEPEPTTEETREDSQDPQIVTMEDYVAWHLEDAQTELESQGFSNVVPKQSDEAPDEYEACEIVSQTPQAGSEVGYDSQVELEYVANDPACM